MMLYWTLMPLNARFRLQQSPWLIMIGDLPKQMPTFQLLNGWTDLIWRFPSQ
jgi:hypothetical protein